MIVRAETQVIASARKRFYVEKMIRKLAIAQIISEHIKEIVVQSCVTAYFDSEFAICWIWNDRLDRER